MFEERRKRRWIGGRGGRRDEDGGAGMKGGK